MIDLCSCLWCSLHSSFSPVSLGLKHQFLGCCFPGQTMCVAMWFLGHHKIHLPNSCHRLPMLALVVSLAAVPGDLGLIWVWKSWKNGISEIFLLGESADEGLWGHKDVSPFSGPNSNKLVCFCISHLSLRLLLDVYLHSLDPNCQEGRDMSDFVLPLSGGYPGSVLSIVSSTGLTHWLLNEWSASFLQDCFS